MKEDHTKRLEHLANRIRLRDLDMICEAGMGHIGGDMSCIDILTLLYFQVLNVNPDNPTDPSRDRFVLSKGHCSGALYVTLAEAGFIDPDLLDTYMKPKSPLNGHPDRKKVPGVETNTGPLGHGMPVATGTAIAAKLKKESWKTYVLLGDGELQEGSNWEAAMAAAHAGLDNLTAIVDRNGLQQGASTLETNELEPLADKWRSFGWAVDSMEGHDFESMSEAFSRLPLEEGRPSCLIARTVKGRGISFMENQAGWHHKVPSAKERDQAAQELGETTA